MGEIRGNKVRYDPNKLVLTAGATSANEILMFCLAEPGEAFLIPTPYYPGYIIYILSLPKFWSLNFPSFFSLFFSTLKNISTP